MSLRALIFLAALTFALFGPWWALLISALLVSMRYRAYEMVLVGAIADVIWLPHDLFWGVPMMMLVTLCILWILEPLRRELFITNGLG